MSKQPEALRLADALDNGCNFYPESSQHFDRELSTAASDASAELRRLHAMNGELLEALKRIKDEPSNTMSDGKALKEIIRIAKAAIAKAEAA